MFSLCPSMTSTTSAINLNANKNKMFTNYKKAMWDNFVHDTEQEFKQLSNNNITNIDIRIKELNNIITTAATKYIPKGNIKKFNPNYTPEIAHQIKQRVNLTHNTPTPKLQKITKKE